MRALGGGEAGGQGELRIFNQFTETFSVNEVAERVKSVGRQDGLRT